ncbi:MAG: methyltransferase domain-containing protein [Caldilineaceae bacterium]
MIMPFTGNKSAALDHLADDLWAVATLAERYNHEAQRWHGLLQRLGYLYAYEQFFATLYRQALLPHGGCVVDCGIGSGGLSLGLLRASRGAWQLEGVDIAAQMLVAAHHVLTPALASGADAGRLTALRLHCADVRQLPLADQAADLAISAHMLEHLVDPQVALREMARVLRSGAPVVVVITRQGWWGSYVRRKWGVTCVTAAQACTWLRQAGFAEVRLVPLPTPFLPCAWSSLACIGFKPKC